MEESFHKGKNPMVIIGLFFILLGILCNEHIIASLFTHNGKIESITYRLLTYIFEISVFLIGIRAIFTRKKVKLFKWIIGVFVFQMVVLIFLFVTEIHLRFQESERQKKNITSPYREFCRQYLHPFYYFFFPQDQKIIDKINYNAVSIDINGFRGDGPEKKNEKKLAFIVGGSAVFGGESTSNQTTICGWLNNIQEEYHFVNAGVPSWNSLQEFYRISMQLLGYNPSLIIAYDGYNDMLISRRHERFRYPPGTPESYEDLERWVDDIRAANTLGPFLINPKYDFRFFQKTDLYLDKIFRPIFPTHSYLSENPTTVSGDIRGHGDSIESQKSKNLSLAKEDSLSLSYCQKSARKYLKNLELMSNICKSYNCKFIAIWQPALVQHKKFSFNNINSNEKNERIYFNNFYEYVFERCNEYLIDLYDFGNIFDNYHNQIQIKDVFLDKVHLSGRGNEIIALEIVNILKKEGVIQREIISK